jgi:FkbM family methyltransferase
LRTFRRDSRATTKPQMRRAKTFDAGVIVLNDRLAVVAGRDGYFLINRNDIFIGKALEIYGEYSGAEAAFLNALIKPGDHVIEAGANIGAHTIGLAKTVGSIGRVYSFEPQPACYSILQAQIALNQISNIVAYPEAIGHASGRIWFPRTDYDALGNFGGIALSRNQTADSTAVEMVSLDERCGDVPCALLKIDVEGMEEDVIRGATKLIHKNQPIIYAENDRVEKSKSLISTLRALGYRLWWHIPPLYNPTNFFNNKENIFDNLASYNMVCARQARDVFGDLVEIKSADDPHPLAPQHA